MEIINLEELEEKEWEDSVECVKRLRRQYPDSVYHKTVTEIVEKLSLQYDQQIQKRRDEYHAIKNFLDRQRFYNEVLSVRELGYKQSKEKIENYFKNPKPKSYEAWVTPMIYDFMKTHGYRQTVEHYISFGNIL
jgi:hypothetical protein